MNELWHQQILDGQQRAPEQPIELRAGALHMLCHHGSLRHITLNGLPVLHQIYMAVRDSQWRTIEGEILNSQAEITEDHFEISYTMVHQQHNIDFVWQAEIKGTADSKISFKLDGVAQNTFKRNRIGFCVLHSMALAGKACVIEHVDGSTSTGQFPDLISPHQPFFNIRAIEHRVENETVVRVLMEGDTFEMEDQRNWTDASYKTYSTPLSLPFPVTVQAGDRISQVITVSIKGSVPKPQAVKTSQTKKEVTIDISSEMRSMPKWGVGLPSHGALPNTQETQRLRALNLAHLRADIHFRNGNGSDQLAYAAQYAQKLQSALEIALFLSDNARTELEFFAQWLRSTPVPIARVAVFHENEKSTERHWVELARESLHDFEVPLGAGTDGFFTQLNRERPPIDLLDFIIYSINPQVHAFDNLSLIENLQGQEETIRTARSFCGNAGIVVSPVTLKTRSSQTTPGAVLQGSVDPRQMSLFGAGWTLGSIKYLSQAGADSVTYYETTGWLGLIETAEGFPLPDKVGSSAAGAYPMYHIFQALADFDGGHVHMSRSSQPLKVESLVLQKGEQQRICVANLTASEQIVTIPGMHTLYSSRILDAMNVRQEPDEFWQNAQQFNLESITLSPYAIAFIDKRRISTYSRVAF